VERSYGVLQASCAIVCHPGTTRSIDHKWEDMNAFVIIKNMTIDSERDDHWVFDQEWDYMNPLMELNWGVLVEFIDFFTIHQKIHDESVHQ
jgi:hypothetical protein